MNREILEYIEHLKKISGFENPCYTYTHGKCAIFAQLLNVRFDGCVLCLPEYHHFVFFCYENEKMYDATGNVTRRYEGVRAYRYQDMNSKQLRGYEVS